VRSFASIFLPSLSSVVFVVALLQVLFLSQGTQGLFRDSDTGWHIRNGEAIIAMRAVPSTDSFSYGRPNAPWLAWEWLADSVFGFVHSHAGVAGVALLAAGTIALTAWAATHLALASGANFFFAAGAAVLLLGTTSLHWLARPHIFSWLLALAFLAIAERERRNQKVNPLLAPLLAAIWANTHGSFLLGPAILLVYAIGEWLSGPTHQIPGRRLALTSLTSLLATFINPYGWHLHEHIFDYLQNSYLMDHIAEYGSYNFHNSGAVYVELFLLVAIAGGLLMLRQRAFGPAFLCFAMLHLSLFSARHLPTAAVLLLPLCAVAYTREIAKSQRWRRFVEYSERLRQIDIKVWGFVPIVLTLLIAIAGVNNLSRSGRVGFSPDKFPVQAVDFLEKHGISGHLFAKDQWGGYLIYRFAGRTPVFVDGRSDFYGRDILESQATLTELKPGWTTLLNQYDIRMVLVPSDSPLAAALPLTAGWKRVYADRLATVFERAS
jgi:hypothetical protein